MPEQCPKCGAELHNTHKERGRIKELWRCWSFRYDGGVFVQTDQCRIRKLTAENERLRAEVEDYRKGAAAEAAAGDEAREELANARDFMATSPTGQQRCYKCNQWIFSYPCMYCGR